MEQRRQEPVNIESFYLTLDDDPALSTPEFDADLAGQIKFYPNPVVNDILTIDSPKDFEYSIVNLEGKVLVEKIEYTGKISMGKFSPGIYFVQLYIGGQSQVYKVVKQ
ncbi:T9SS type A sorting domain-containing protein [Aquimarina agarivorans]|uniref:T9SS type A sorting domain-containing protein n=1 Tax=Aquimarina agarivorans TaxID=980584 RepID=UPI000248EC5A|nr:T9SS type A sorting domain-containing protein [Aquimarina agarivorans]